MPGTKNPTAPQSTNTTPAMPAYPTMTIPAEIAHQFTCRRGSEGIVTVISRSLRKRGRERGHLKASVDINLQVAYFTTALINQKVFEYADGHPRQHVCGACGSYPARDPGAPRFEGRGVRQRAGRALRDDPARGFQAPQGLGACWPDLARPRGAVAALPIGGGSAEGGRRLGGAISPLLGAELRSLGRVSARATEGRERRWRTMMSPTRSHRSRSLSSRACSTLRASSCSRRGRSLSTSCAGGVRRATPRRLSQRTELEQTGLTETDGVTHLAYRVVR